MKKLSFLFLLALSFAACQNKETTATAGSSADTTKYPYTIKDPEEWEMNKDPKNLLAAMNAVKAFENLDTAALKEFIGDSINLVVDGYEFKGLKAEFIKSAQEEMNKYKNITITLQDRESVINKDKTEEWVSLWYKQVHETKDGKKDSLNFFNDLRIKNGKVIIWSEYIQHPMAK
ncbi:hypothetical protein [Pedobacter frigiditerrae]|uniref:hypothetical protein n=1 Tax=Pedobacter frigiditerrae TaxID=2530452 RepID=UPI002930A629|nr:hypothetical protein [Pedobacter frigiditerrae]